MAGSGEVISPFVSPVGLLDRLLGISAQISTLTCSHTGADRNAQQLGKCMTFLDLLLADLKDTPSGLLPPASLYALQSALQAALQLVRHAVDSSTVVAIITGRFSTGYRRTAVELKKALQGLMAESSGLDEDAIGSIDHLQRRLSSVKFAADPAEERAADEVRLQATLLDLGRVQETQGLRDIMTAVKGAMQRDLSIQELQHAIQSVQASIGKADPGSFGADQKLLSRLKDALMLELHTQPHTSPPRPAAPSQTSGTSYLMNHNSGQLHPGLQAPHSMLASPPEHQVQDLPMPSSRAHAFKPSGVDPLDRRVSGSSHLSATASFAHASEVANSSRPMSVTSDEADVITDRSWRSSEGSTLWHLSDKGEHRTNESDRSARDRGIVTAERTASLSRLESAPLSTSSQHSSRDGASRSEEQQQQSMRTWHSQPVPSSLESLALTDTAVDWILAEADLTICKREDGSDFLLGRGAFGRVYKALMGKVEPVALKVLGGEAEEAASPEAQHRAIRELKLLKDCRNPHIVQFLGGLLFSGQVAIVTELMPLGDLHSALRSQRIVWGPRALQIAVDVARGLAFLHHRRIAHLDLKSPNILLGRDYKAKIADVGIARVLTESQVSTVTSTGTFAWAAPELLLGNKVTEIADIYSFGVVLWELVTGEQPRRGQLRNISVPDEAPADVEALVTQCMDLDPQKRPLARSIAQRLMAVEHQLLHPSRASSGSFQEAPSPTTSGLSRPSLQSSGHPPRSDVPRRQTMGSNSSMMIEGGNMMSTPSPFGPTPVPARMSSSDLADRPSNITDLDRASEADSFDFDDHRRVRARMPSTGSAKLDQQLQDLVQHDCTVRELSLAERSLGADGIHAVAVMLAKNTSLRRLDLRRNRPDAHSIRRLMAALQRNRTLVMLDLRDCSLGREGGQHLATMLNTNSSLGELSLWNTNLRQEGAVAIIRALHNNNSLQRLDLGCNELGPEVGREVACMLERNTGLETLDLRNNRLSKLGITAIAEGTQGNTSLRQLKLGNNAVTALFGMGALKSMFKQRQSATGLTTTLS